MATDNETIEYDIRLSAQGALVQLAELAASTSSFKTKMKEAQLAVDSFASRTGASLSKVKELFKGIDEEFAGGKGRSVVFGGAGSSPWDSITNSVKMTNAELQKEHMLVEKIGAALSHKLVAKQTLFDQGQLEKANQAAQKQIMAEEKKAELRQKNLNLAQQEQQAVEKEGAALQKQLGLYGQISRTSAETMNVLRSFSGTQQGQSILTKFFGDYKAAQGVTQQISTIQSAIGNLSKATGASFAQSGQIIKEQFSKIPGIANQTTQAVSQMGKSFQEAGQKAQSGINTIRIALGILVSMLIHNVIQAFQTAFSTAIHNLRETELAVYNLINAERRLSEAGIDVTPKGLQETIDGIRELVPILSQIQAEELVSRIASNVAPAVKFDAGQIKQMSEAIALLYIRNKALGKSFEEVESQVTNAFLTGRVSQGINNLGVKLSDQIVRDEALRLGLVKTEEEFDNLTGEMEAQIKASAMLSVVYKNATQDVESLGSYMQTTDAAIEATSTAWNNLLTTVASKFGPIIIEYLTGVVYWLERANEWLTKNQEKAENFAAVLAGATRVMVEVGKIRAEQNILDQTFNVGENANRIGEAFRNGVKDALEANKELADAIDTPTAAVENLNEAVDDFDASKMLDQIQDILDKTREAQQDLDIEFGRKTLDLDIEYDRKGADAYLDYQRKVEDINREAEDKIAEIKQKHREEDIQREAEYQNKLWELQQKYLMDLEDALHNRDARQIIRLQREYELEKEMLARRNELEEEESNREERGEIRDVRDDQRDDLEEAAIDYQRKLQDLNIAKEREQQDLQTWYAREQADLQLDQDRKLQALTEGWAEAGTLTEQNAGLIYSIIAGYFGPGGLTDQIYAYMRASLAQAMAMAGSISLPMGQPAPYSQLAAQGSYAQTATPIQQLTSGGYPEPYTPAYVPRPGGYAEGGAFLATTRDSITVGERGPELVQTTPIGREGMDVNRFFMGAGGEGSETGGQMEIGIMLSPDLEARILRKNMDATANVILKVNRSKV